MFIVDKDKCQGCGVCLNVCPVGAISFAGDVAHIDSGRCVKCGRCASVCPAGAITSDENISNKQTPKTNPFSIPFSPFPFFRGGGGFRKGRGRGRGGRGGF